MRWSTLGPFVLACCAACGNAAGRGPSMEPDARAPDVGSDAAVTPDDASEPERNDASSIDASTAAARDAGADGSSSSHASGDGAAEAGDASERCAAASACEATRRGPEGECLIENAPDGSECDPAGVCVAGACVVRTGCGDGYREAGPEPAAEGCDDGNALDGDACSALCVPTWLAVDGPALAPDAANLTLSSIDAVAVDDTGAVLALGVSTSDERAWLWAQRFSPALVPLGTASLLAQEAKGTRFEAAAVGLTSGWLVTRTASDDGDLTGVEVLTIASDGVQGPTRWLHQQHLGRQYGSRLARLGSDIFAVWIETATTDLGSSARVLLATRSAAASDFSPAGQVASSGGPIAELSLAAGERELMLAFVEVARGQRLPRVLASRLDLRGRPQTAEPVAVSTADGFAVSSTALRDGSFVLGYTSRAEDARGDVLTRRIGPEPDRIDTAKPLAATLDTMEWLAGLAPSAGGGFVALVHHGRPLRDYEQSAYVAASTALSDTAQVLLASRPVLHTLGSGLIAATRRGVLVGLVGTADEAGATHPKLHMALLSDP